MNRKRKRRFWIWGTVVLVLVAVAVVAVVVGQRDRDVLEVTVETIGRTRLVAAVGANGTLEAQRKVDLSADIMGQIVNLAVREGDRVEKGDFLLQIDQTQHRASAAGAEASLEALFHDRDAARASEVEARASFERAQKSYADELIPVSELDRARAALDSAAASVAAIEKRIDQARATLAGARDTLSKTKIVAPMAGVVTRLPVEEGEVAVIGTMNNPGTELMTISDMSAIQAVMEVDETDVPQVRLGQAAEVTIDAYGDRIFNGTVTEVGSSPMATTGTEAVDFEVKIRLEEPPEGVRPGFSCSAEIITDTRESALAAPIQALVVREKPESEEGAGSGRPEEEEGVYLYDPETGTAGFAVVETGITGATQVEVLSGLEEGQQVITGPFRALREIEEGDRVKLAEEKPGEEAE